MFEPASSNAPSTSSQLHFVLRAILAIRRPLINELAPWHVQCASQYIHVYIVMQLCLLCKARSVHANLICVTQHLLESQHPMRNKSVTSRTCRSQTAIAAHISRGAQTILVRGVIFWTLEALEPELSVLPTGLWDGYHKFPR